MVGVIFKHEVRMLLRKRLLWWLLPMVVMLTLLVSIVHWQQQESFRQTQSHWQQVNNELWQAQPDRHPHRVAHYGSLAFRQASPLSFLDAGINPYTGNALFLEAHKQNSAGLQQFSISAGHMALGYLSVATVVLVLWPLLLIALGFSSVSDERESGRLRFLVPLGVNARSLLAGKSLAYLALSVLFLVALFALALGFVVMSDWPDRSDAALRLLLMFVLYTAYCAVWSVLIVGLSRWARTNTQSLISLVLLWLALIVLIPKGLPWVAQQLYPVPDRASFEIRLDKMLAQVGDAHDPADPHFSAFREQVLSRYGVKRIEDLPVNWNGLVMAEGERITSEVFQTHYAEVQTVAARQERLRKMAAVVSPYLLASHLSQVLSGSDLHSFYRFEQQAEDYRYQLIQTLNQLHTDTIARDSDREQRLAHRHWQEIPLFHHQPESWRQVSSETYAWAAAGLLWLWLLPALVLGWLGRRVNPCAG